MAIGSRHGSTITAKYVWLRDFLPTQLRELEIRPRIMSFGYNANTTFTKSVGGISDQSMVLLDRLEGKRMQMYEQQRPIILLAHGLGGLVVKRYSLDTLGDSTV